MKTIIFDRLYGKLTFSPIVEDLLDCPGLLRLREVHMSSIPFVGFPSFSSVNRYEHSLGVCHLAHLASETLELAETEKAELMVAALYHDVATPPFAHVTEELMEEFFSFDHEEHLRNLLVGKTDDLGMDKSQIYYGKGLKLFSVIAGDKGRKMGLDIFRIADMAVGKGKLGVLVNGQLDLDNIDNVIRAATAMGVTICDGEDAEVLSRGFVLANEGIALRKENLCQLQKWQQTRFTLYDMIYGAVEDFSLQTMLKLAIRMLLEADDERKLTYLDWRITDEELISDRIKQHQSAKRIWEKICLFRPFPCIGIFSLRGKGSYSYVKNNLLNLENLAKGILGTDCLANFTKDKRHRSVTYPLASFSSTEETIVKAEEPENVFLFFFAPNKVKLGGFYEQLTLRLRACIPSDINLSTARRINDKYPRIIEERLV